MDSFAFWAVFIGHGIACSIFSAWITQMQYRSEIVSRDNSLKEMDRLYRELVEAEDRAYRLAKRENELLREEIERINKMTVNAIAKVDTES